MIEVDKKYAHFSVCNKKKKKITDDSEYTTRSIKKT